MPDDARRRHLWRLLDRHREDWSFRDLPSVVEGLERVGEALDYDDLAYLSQRLNGHRRGAFTPPSYLCRFVAELLASREALSVLDPNAGEGWLPARVSSLVRAANVVAVTDNPLAPWLSEKLRLDRLTIMPHEPSGTFDAIVSMPPVFGGQRDRRPTPDRGREVRDEPGLLRMLDVAALLSDGGIIIWIVPPRFAFNNAQHSVRRNLRHFNLHLSGLLQVTPGTFAPVTHMGFELALIERAPQDDLFVAEIPGEVAAQDELISRLRQRVDGPQPKQGRVVVEKAFFGLDALEAAERAKRLADRRGLIASPFSEVVVEINRPRRRPGEPFERLPHHPDALYLPEMAKTAAVTLQEQLPERLQSYLQVIVRREKATPEYLAGLLNTPLGHAIREAASSGATMPRINRDRLVSTTVYLPPISDQEKAVAALDSIQLLRLEVNELEAQVWERPRRVAEVQERLMRVNHEDRFQDWIETLPFPLASILRAYHAVDRTDKEKYERLLHFFEALAAFTATVHLSALRADNALYLALRERLAPVFESQHFRWSHPTFGMWRAVIDAAVPVRRMLNGGPDEKAQIMSLYATADPVPVEVLVSRQLITLLEQNIDFRNRWPGHGGAVSEGEAARRHREIAEALNSFRSLCGSTFLRYQTIAPREPRVLPGPVFKCPARRVMGSNPQFEHTEVELLTPPVTGGLYLHNPGHTTALELLRLVQIREAPQAVCYFYNRLDSSGSHLVSYHFGEQANVTEPEGELASLINDLSSPPA